MDQEFARLRIGEDVRQQVPDLVHRGEALENRDESAVLALRGLGVDDVVVEVVRPVARRYCEELWPRRMNEHATQTTDFRRDVGGHGAKLTMARWLVQPESSP